MITYITGKSVVECPFCHKVVVAAFHKPSFAQGKISRISNKSATKYYRQDDSDPDRLDEIKSMVQKNVSYEDFQKFKDELFENIVIRELETSRTESEMLAAIDELFDKVWYNRHQYLRALLEAGETTVDPEIWKGALKAASKVEKRYPEGRLGPWDDFEWGMINGKLSALRWIMGDEWDMLDT